MLEGFFFFLLFWPVMIVVFVVLLELLTETCNLAVLIHELGHLLVAKLLGVEVTKARFPSILGIEFEWRMITFSATPDVELGYYTMQEKVCWWEVVLISFAGPGINLLIAALILIFYPFGLSLTILVVAPFFFWNVVAGVTNLVPFDGYDGRHICRALAEGYSIVLT